MQQSVGLRERKKQRTRDAISDAAISLFLERGFDQVSVLDVAEAAEVSKPTLFRYFSTKEDLVVHRFADHEAELGDVVRRRRPGQPPLEALRRHFLDRLAAHDPITGLNDSPSVLTFHNLVYSTPSLVARIGEYLARSERELGEALGPALAGRHPTITAALLAGQVVSVERVLAQANWRRVLDGRSAVEVYPQAVADAEHAFAMLRNALDTGV